MNLNRRLGKAQNIMGVYPRLKKVMIALSVVVVIGLAIVVVIKIFAMSSAGPSVARETVKKFNLKPGQEISYQVPPRHWFRIYSDQNVEVKTWSGRPISDLSWLGDEIRDANFKLKSKETTKDAVVVITLRQK